MNLPNRGQVANLPDDVVVECIGATGSSRGTPAGHSQRRIGARRVPAPDLALPGAHRRRRLDRRPNPVLEAMLTDQLAGQLPYEHLVAMTDELLTSTASWLPQFAPS